MNVHIHFFVNNTFCVHILLRFIYVFEFASEPSQFMRIHFANLKNCKSNDVLAKVLNSRMCASPVCQYTLIFHRVFVIGALPFICRVEV